MKKILILCLSLFFITLLSLKMHGKPQGYKAERPDRISFYQDWMLYREGYYVIPANSGNNQSGEEIRLRAEYFDKKDKILAFDLRDGSGRIYIMTPAHNFTITVPPSRPY